MRRFRSGSVCVCQVGGWKKRCYNDQSGLRILFGRKQEQDSDKLTYAIFFVEAWGWGGCQYSYAEGK